MIKTLYHKFKQQFDKHHKLIITGLFLVYLLVGLFIYNDYGLSWDENLQKQNGHANYNFIFHGDKKTLLERIDKYHGPAFELALVFVEKALSLTDSRDIYLLRHLITFLVFFISAIFFYLLAVTIFKDKYLSLIAALMYVLSPHIFSHSFYNSKDAAFLAFFVISIYTLILFYNNQTYLNAILFAFISAFTIDTRIIGILIPTIFVFIIFVQFVFGLINKTRSKAHYKKVFTYFIFLFPLIILFWPVLWLDPLHHFMEALKENSYYPWDGKVLYFGQYYNASKLPRHYLPFWIFISKPIIYSLLFIVGVIVLLKQFISKPINFFKEKKSEIIILSWFFLPLLAVVVFKTRTFDTGRHFYFIHGGYVLIALFGLQYIFFILKDRKILFYSINAILFFSFISVSSRMVNLHPYQHLYFNSVARTDMDNLKDKFEMDYWGLSSRKVLEKILELDSRSKIRIYAENYPAELNVEILPKESRKRLVITETPEKADYFIADYRLRKAADYPYKKEFCSVKIGNTNISAAFQVRNIRGINRQKWKRI
jgi:hypothetical protein